MRAINIKEIAIELKEAQDDCTQLDPITSRFLNFSIADAYDAAHLIHQQRLEEGWFQLVEK